METPSSHPTSRSITHCTASKSPLSSMAETTTTNDSSMTTPQPLIQITDLSPKQIYDFFRRAYTEVRKQKVEGQARPILKWSEFIAWRAIELHGFLHKPKYFLGSTFELLAWNVLSDHMFKRHASKFIVLLEAIKDILLDRKVMLHSFIACHIQLQPWKDAFILLLHLLKRRRHLMDSGDLKERTARLLINISQDFVIGKGSYNCFGTPPEEFLDLPIDSVMEIFQFQFPEPEKWPPSSKSDLQPSKEDSVPKDKPKCKDKPSKEKQVKKKSSTDVKSTPVNHAAKPAPADLMPPPDVLYQNPRPKPTKKRSVPKPCDDGDRPWKQYLAHEAPSQLSKFRKRCREDQPLIENGQPHPQRAPSTNLPPAKADNKGQKRARPSSLSGARDQSSCPGSPDLQPPQPPNAKKPRTLGPLTIHKPVPPDLLAASKDYCLPARRHRRPIQPLFDRLAGIGWEVPQKLPKKHRHMAPPTIAVVPRGHTTSQLNLPLKDGTFKFQEMPSPADLVVTPTSITPTLTPIKAGGAGVEAMGLLRPFVQKFGIFCTKNFTAQQRAYQSPKPSMRSSPIRG
ncbi:hypothetical protein BDN72DRAFT_836353 [Pluteus cervinus]|uniref:Uncharacterized protein n=1 Tax=Pluteus cervinus TaxID=181527 RepID=A0ACD3B3Z3_9AGAR|nr:hypothetical protein BDN72DRAFT_836353 [Pluteus cervinus]